MEKAKTDAVYYNRPNIHIGYEQPLMPYHKKVAELVAKYCKNSSSVIDIGCGVGHTLIELQRKRPDLNLYATDIDEGTLCITKKKVKLKAAIKIDSVVDIIDKSQKYNVIIMSHVLEHMYRPLDILKGVINILEPNGIIVLAVPNPVRLEVFIRNMLQSHYVNRGHVYAWDRSHWINFLEKIAGLEVLEYSQDFFPIPVLRNMPSIIPFQIWLSKIFPWLAFSNIAVVRA